MIDPRNTHKRANFVQVLYEKSTVSADFGLKADGTFYTLPHNVLQISHIFQAFWRPRQDSNLQPAP